MRRPANVGPAFFVCEKGTAMAEKKQTKKEAEAKVEEAVGHPEPNRLPNDQLVVTGDTRHPEEYVDHVSNETELANSADEDNYAGGPEYLPK
jgi:hypothetical protein